MNARQLGIRRAVFVRRGYGGGAASRGAAEKPVVLLAGLGNWHHPIATGNPEAQKFFDQGLTLVYSFNKHEALRAFRKASELDPRAAMNYWGIAMALGPYINMDGDPDVQMKESCDAVQAGLKIAGQRLGRARVAGGGGGALSRFRRPVQVCPRDARSGGAAAGRSRRADVVRRRADDSGAVEMVRRGRQARAGRRGSGASAGRRVCGGIRSIRERIICTFTWWNRRRRPSARCRARSD